MNNKILFISSEFPPGPGGIGNHASNIANELARKGYQIIINTSLITLIKIKRLCLTRIVISKSIDSLEKKTIIQSWINRFLG